MSNAPDPAALTALVEQARALLKGGGAPTDSAAPPAPPPPMEPASAPPADPSPEEGDPLLDGLRGLLEEVRGAKQAQALQGALKAAGVVSAADVADLLRVRGLLARGDDGAPMLKVADDLLPIDGQSLRRAGLRPYLFESRGFPGSGSPRRVGPIGEEGPSLERVLDSQSEYEKHREKIWRDWTRGGGQ